jgi:hypothetical protein
MYDESQNLVSMTETLEYLQLLVCEFDPCIEPNPNTLGLS